MKNKFEECIEKLDSELFYRIIACIHGEAYINPCHVIFSIPKGLKLVIADSVVNTIKEEMKCGT